MITVSPVVFCSQHMLFAVLISATGVLAREPFPQWLRDMTGMQDWPGDNPPYIPMPRVGLESLPSGPRYDIDQCSAAPEHVCSFYCSGCVRADDIVHCPVLSQTFDDGPTLETNDLLDTLSQSVTFFTLGKQVVEHPEVFRRQIDEGHLVASHTWSHPYLPSLSTEEIAAQFQWSIWAMNVTGGVVPRFYRPPYGGVDHRVRDIALRLGLITVLWDRDSEDWRLNDDSITRPEILNNLAGWKTGRRSRGLILEHDNSRKTVDMGRHISRRLGRQYTVAACVGSSQWYQN